jgi:uncharacterized protein YndB with AHSA1/START domain
MSESYDWTTFDLYFYYNFPLKQVWGAWATPRGLCSFFVEKCTARDSQGRVVEESGEIVAGGTYNWVSRHLFEMKGDVLKVEREKLIVFTFGSMRVDVEFRDTGRGIEVHLRQSAISSTGDGQVFGHLNCRSCWIFFMTNLVSVLANGLDLRDSDPKRASSMEVGYVPVES